MITHDDARLERLLTTRHSPQAPEAMDRHIINLAEAVKQDGRGDTARDTRPWYIELLQALVIPKPAYALAVMLLFGLMIGLDMAVLPDDSVVGDWSTLFASGDNWL